MNQSNYKTMRDLRKNIGREITRQLGTEDWHSVVWTIEVNFLFDLYSDFRTIIWSEGDNYVIDFTSASRAAKYCGYRSLKHLAKRFGVTTETLRNYHSTDLQKFKAVLNGCGGIGE